MGNDCLNPSTANHTDLGPIRLDPWRRGAYPPPRPRACLKIKVRRAGISPRVEIVDVRAASATSTVQEAVHGSVQPDGTVRW